MTNGKPKKAKCACGCGQRFVKRRRWQKYLDRTHQNRATQKRMRERSKRYLELAAEQHGALGATGGTT